MIQLCSYKSSIRVTGINCRYENDNEEKRKIKYNKKHMSYFLRQKTLKLQESINADKQNDPVNQFILASASSYCGFYIPLVDHAPFFFIAYFHTPFSMFLFLFHRFMGFHDRLQSKPVAANQMIQYCYCSSSTVGQLNVQAATAEKNEQYNLSNIIYKKI